MEGLKSFAAGFFTAATLRSYLEHELHPRAVLTELHRTLAPGGVALVKVPNYASLNRRVTGRKWCGFRYPDHLNYFTPASLAPHGRGMRLPGAVRPDRPAADQRQYVRGAGEALISCSRGRL